MCLEWQTEAANTGFGPSNTLTRTAFGLLVSLQLYLLQDANYFWKKKKKIKKLSTVMWWLKAATPEQCNVFLLLHSWKEAFQSNMLQDKANY